MPPDVILLVEADPAQATALETILQTEGYHTRLALSGATALAEVIADPPALVLLDATLPDLNGYEIARRIKGDPDLPFVPIILITVRSDLRGRLHALEQGADELLPRPVHRAELLARVRALLRLRHALDDMRTQHAELTALHDRLQATERLHQERVEMITHDLRGPLTAIKAALDLLDDEALGPLTDRQRHFAHLALLNCRMMNQMISDLLDVYRMEAGHADLAPAPVDLHRLAQTACDRVASLAVAQGLALSNAVPADLPPVPADPDRLVRVLINLISNALKFTEDGSVTVTAEPGDDRTVVVAVVDTGRGVPLHERAHVFDKFYRVRGGLTGERSRAGGTGLGLTFCRQTVEAHGGRIWVEPGPDGTGSRFAFTLPLPTADH